MNAPLIHIFGCLLAAALGTQEPTAAQETQQDNQTPPSLDELLGLDGLGDNAAEQAVRQNQEELERRLSEVELGDVFDVALEKMELSADLLDGDLNSGLGTQRVQQDILARHDQLIDLAKQMSQQQMRSSSGGAGQYKPEPVAEVQQSGGQAGPGDVAAVWTAPTLPVDKRHNSKIDRSGIARWAGRVLAGGRMGRI